MLKNNTIAIVTYYNNGSYGAVMQAWALQQAISRIGYKSSVVRYTMQYPLPPPLWRIFLSRSITSFKNRLRDCVSRKFICSFAEKRLSLTSNTYKSIEELRQDPPEAEVYVCGRDQIWNTWRYDQGQSVDYGYFLDFGDLSKKRIAYAASFGRAEVPRGFQIAVKSCMERFDALGVREVASVGIVREICAKEAKVVLDPTLLLEDKDYCTLFDGICEGRGAAARFILGSERKSVASVTNKLKMLTRSDFRDIGGTVEGWLGSIAAAEFVFTDSFHAVAFSIIFHRPFLVLLRSGGAEGRNVRLINLLSLLGLSDRAISVCDEESVASVCQKSIDWGDVESRLSELRIKSIEFLQKALGD